MFPALVPAAATAAWRKRREPDTLFLLAWIGIFLAGSAVLFFAGSARYLLPMAAPVALLASRLPARWLGAGFALQLALALGLASVNYQHWNRYRRMARSLNSEGHRVWIDGCALRCGQGRKGDVSPGHFRRKRPGQWPDIDGITDWPGPDGKRRRR